MNASIIGAQSLGITFVLLTIITASLLLEGERWNSPSDSNMMEALFPNPEIVARIEAIKTTSAIIDPSIVNKV
jgi:hypothetical protein